MLLLDHHPTFPYGTSARHIRIDGVPDEAVAATAHIIADRMVFVALDGDTFRVGYVNQDGDSFICPESAVSPQISTAPNGFAYVTRSGDVCVIELTVDSLFTVSGPAHSVTLSSNLKWAALRGENGTTIRNVLSNRVFQHSEEIMLAIADDGLPILTMSEAIDVLYEFHAAEGLFTLRDTILLGGVPFACFDSLHGTAVVLKDKISPVCNVRWIPGRWVIGIVRENDYARVALQRLNQLDSVKISTDSSELRPEPALEEQQLFDVEQVDSPDGTKVPISRFRLPRYGQEPRSLVTVHGGFGISLRPISGVATQTSVGDIVYAHVRGGGELGNIWAQSGRGSLKQNSLDDLCAVLQNEINGGRRVSLLGTSHGGWLAVLAAMQEPTTVDRICVTSPITHLREYLSSPLGVKHRSEFPNDDDLDSFDPIIKVAALKKTRLPQLMIICGTVDSTVLGQRFEEFANLWRRTGGSCEVIQHNGGHYAPSAGEVVEIERAQARFLGIVSP